MFYSDSRIRRAFFLATFLIFVFLITCARAEFLELKEKAIKLEKIGSSKTIFDNFTTKAKGMAFPGLEHADGGALKQFWIFAGAGPIDSGYLGTKIESARLSIAGMIVDAIRDSTYDESEAGMRGINYQDFILVGNLPEGSKVKCNLIVYNDCYGFVNAARYAGAQTRYYLKFDSGLLLGRYLEDWDKPALGMTLFSQTDDPNPPDVWSRDLRQKINTEAGKTLISYAADIGLNALRATVAESTVIGLAVDELVNAIEGVFETNKYVDDKYHYEFFARGEKAVQYKDIWLSVSSMKNPNIYRVYNKIEGKVLAQANPKMQDGEQAAVYIDFFNHWPHWGDDDSSISSTRGFGVKQMYLSADPSSIVFPNGYRYSVIDVAEVTINNFGKPVLLGKPTPLQVKFVVRNNAGFTKPCSVEVKTPEQAQSFVTTVYSEYGSEYVHSFDYIFNKPGKHTFVFTIDPKHELDPHIDLTHEQRIDVDVAAEADLKSEIISVDGDYEINKEMAIRVRVTNNGTAISPDTTIDLWPDKKERLPQQKVKPLAPKEHADAVFKWTPKQEGDFELVCEVDFEGKLREYSVENNRGRKQIRIQLPAHQWVLQDNSLICVPDKPQAGEAAKIYFTLKNNGRNADTLGYDIFVDEKKIKSDSVLIASGETLTVGSTGKDEIIWKATGGRHVIKAVLDPMYRFSDFPRTRAVQELIIEPEIPMPAVEGIDLVLLQQEVSKENDKLSFRVYNRGTKPWCCTDIYIYQYASGREKPYLAESLRRAFAPQSYENFYFPLPPDSGQSKFEIVVDPLKAIAEADENNNSAIYTFPGYQPYRPPPVAPRAKGSDLIVVGASNLDGPLEVGQKRQVEISIANQNLIDAGKVQVDYAFSNLDTQDRNPAHGYLEGKEVLDGVRAEEKRSFSLDYPVVYPGNYELNVWIDQAHLVPETDEMNNSFRKYFTVEGEVTSQMFFADKNVDLAIDDKVQVSNLKPNAAMQVTFKVTVRNNSDIVVWGADLDMLIDDKLEAKEALGDMPANSTKELTFQHVFNASGNYNVKFTVDAKNAVPEKNEKNNTASVVVEVRPGIFGTGHLDAAVTSFSLNKTSCLQGEFVTAVATIKNVGQDTLRGVLSTIGPYNSSPVYFKIVPIMTKGEEIKISTTLPALAIGDHVVEARVDGKDLFKEDNENNNVLTAVLHVEPITKEKITEKAGEIVIEKANKIVDTIDRWLGGIGKPKQ